MKIYFLLIPFLLIIFSCTADEKNQDTEISAEKVENMENAGSKLENTLDSSEVVMDTLQNEIDSLLKDI